VRIFRRRPRLRPLDEQECYARLHGVRTGEVAVVEVERLEVERFTAPPRTPSLEPNGPTEESPALHLVFAYPRNAARLSGEELRLELLRRMSARTGHAA
jgi:hypothetical protein